MKTYQKAELIAKNLPTGSYAAGCPTDGGTDYYWGYKSPNSGIRYGEHWPICSACECPK